MAVVIITGPPGAGKTTLARRMARDSAAERAVHLHTDDFYAAIRKGFIQPWLKESNDQNTIITRAIAAAAFTYAANGYEVMLDGIVGPWFLQFYQDEATRTGVALHYISLHPAKHVAVQRARDRTDNPIPDYPPNIYEGLSDLGSYQHHKLDIGMMSTDEVMTIVLEGLASGRFLISS